MFWVEGGIDQLSSSRIPLTKSAIMPKIFILQNNVSKLEFQAIFGLELAENAGIAQCNGMVMLSFLIVGIAFSTRALVITAGVYVWLALL